MASVPQVPRVNPERRFYLAAAGVAAAIVFVGFARTYYLKGAFGTPSLGALVHVHGLVMTAWIALFVGQAGLVAARRVDLHRRLGVAGAVLAAAVFVVGVATAIEGARHGVSPGPPPLVFLAIPLGVIAVYAAFVAAAVLNRRRGDWHKRLMLLATITMLTPAIARIPVASFQAGGILLFLAVTDMLALACAAWDTSRNRRLHPAFGFGIASLVISQVLMLATARSAWWQDVAKALVS
jgi:hypothetical protein